MHLQQHADMPASYHYIYQALIVYSKLSLLHVLRASLCCCLQPKAAAGWLEFLQDDDLAAAPEALPGLEQPSKIDGLLHAACGSQLDQKAAAEAHKAALLADYSAAAAAGGGFGSLDDDPFHAALQAEQGEAPKLQLQMSDAAAEVMARTFEVSQGMLAACAGYKRLMRKQLKRMAKLQQRYDKVRCCAECSPSPLAQAQLAREYLCLLAGPMLHGLLAGRT